jgi:hypothetical protein
MVSLDECVVTSQQSPVRQSLLEIKPAFLHFSGLVDFTHATGSQVRRNLVMCESGADNVFPTALDSIKRAMEAFLIDEVTA